MMKGKENKLHQWHTTSSAPASISFVKTNVFKSFLKLADLSSMEVKGNLGDICHDLANRLSHYLYFFSFLFFYFSYRWTREIKVTHKEAWDSSVGLGSEVCISSIENPTGTLSSSLCQILNKETVGLIPVIGLWLLTTL